MKKLFRVRLIIWIWGNFVYKVEGDDVFLEVKKEVWLDNFLKKFWVRCEFKRSIINEFKEIMLIRSRKVIED